MGRKKARDNAFKCVYQIEFLNENKEEKINDILNECYEENENIEEEKEYISSSIKGVIKNIDSIDKLILDKLKNWSIDRIAKVDLAILRLASYELLYTEIPVKVVANEAVELAKTYGNDDSSSFVNGVIAKIIENKKG